LKTSNRLRRPAPAFEELDDWLLELQAESQGDEARATAMTQAVEPSQDIPDWLKIIPEGEEKASSAEFRVDSEVSGWVLDEDGPMEIEEPEADPPPKFQTGSWR